MIDSLIFLYNWQYLYIIIFNFDSCKNLFFFFQFLFVVIDLHVLFLLFDFFYLFLFHQFAYFLKSLYFLFLDRKNLILSFIEVRIPVSFFYYIWNLPIISYFVVPSVLGKGGSVYFLWFISLLYYWFIIN